ncbi:MAG: lytic transglycosylase domain-containing protein [Nitrospiraceae bacterium]
MAHARPWTLHLSIICSIAVGELPLSADPVYSEVYQYIDARGVISLTNVPTDARYRRIDLTLSQISHSPIPVQELDRVITRSARLHRLHPALVRAIIKAESDFDPRAVSRAGALGLMQLMPNTAIQHNVRDAFDPEENIAGGTKHLRYLLDRFHGNLPLALAAYNAGEQAVDRYQALPPISETRRYVQKVLRFYRRFLLTPSPIHPTPPTP